jgi:hypothetical protein
VALANEIGFPHVGRVDFLDNTLNPSTGTIRARVVLPNPTHSLTSGLFARVQLQSPDLARAILIRRQGRPHRPRPQICLRHWRRQYRTTERLSNKSTLRGWARRP